MLLFHNSSSSAWLSVAPKTLAHFFCFYLLKTPGVRCFHLGRRAKQHSLCQTSCQFRNLVFDLAC